MARNGTLKIEQCFNKKPLKIPKYLEIDTSSQEKTIKREEKVIASES